jgi:hypothetical protein
MSWLQLARRAVADRRKRIFFIIERILEDWRGLED